MHAQQYYWWAAGAALLIAVISGVAEHKRLNRRRLDDIGWVPWRGIQVAAAFAAIAMLILALKAG